MNKQGYTIEFPKEVYTGTVAQDTLTLYGPYVKVAHRGNTLDGGLLTMTLSSPAPDVVCVKLENHKGRRKKQAEFAIQPAQHCPVAGEDNEYYLLQTGSTTARVKKGDGWQLEILYQGEPVVSSFPRGAAHIAADSGECYMRERLALDVGEAIYGLGERFGPFVKNGQSVDIWNADGGTDSEQTYKNIPFYLSSKGYGVFVRHTGKVSYEIGSEAVTAAQFSVPGECLEYYIFTGGSPKAALSGYTALLGRPPLVPDWSFGLWLSTSFTSEYNEETVLGFIDGMLDRGIPLSVFHFDCFWMKEFEWSNFLWNRELFPEPQRMLERIHQRGIKVSVWINPYIAQKSPLFAEGMEHNYFVNTGDGDVWQWDRWQAGMALVDFTNPEATRWYQQKLAALVEMGVDSFKTDFGERIPVQDRFYGARAEREGIAYHDKSDSCSMHNYYSYLYNQAVFQLLEEKLGKGQACVFARAATAGTQQFPVNWGGDNLSNYPSMAESLRGGLSLSLCGFAYWSHDIGGFEAGCTPDIYKRWTQFGLLSSHSRYHGNQEYKVPWLYGEEAVEVTRSFTRLKNRMMPYLQGLAAEAAHTGLPLMRAMMLEFPHCKSCQSLDLQYMLGDALLVAPIFNNTGRCEYYLPEGNWVNILTKALVAGGRWVQEQHGYATLPLLLRPNKALLLGNCEQSTDYDYSAELTLLLGEITPEARIEVPAWRRGVLAGKIHLARRQDALEVHCEGFAPQLTLEQSLSGRKTLLPGGNGTVSLV